MYIGRTQLVDKEPHKDIPFGWYDVGDGLYNPDSRVVYTYTNKFLRNAGTYIRTYVSQGVTVDVDVVCT